jgi:hypothetical protein|eukprot:COSAG02_NODE_31365_length_535_cov_0.591743_1_plen_41_part_10
MRDHGDGQCDAGLQRSRTVLSEGEGHADGADETAQRGVVSV